MSTYKNLIGKNVNSLATDPDNVQAEGQIWYNSTAGAFKDLILTNAWSSGGNLITAKYETAGFGTQTAAVMAAGCIPPANASTDVQEYNGTGFSTATAYPEKMRNGAGCGTETAGLAFGGRRDSAPSGSNAPLSLTAEYDGSSWTTGGSMGAGRYGLGAAGTQTAAVGFAGYIASNSPFVPPAGDSNRTEEYNGTAWTTGNTMGTARYRLAGNGTQTAALGAGGYVYPSTTNNTETEEYDGTNWTSGGALPEGKKGPRSWGAQTDAVLTGGSKPPSNTAITATINYDGSSWSSNPASLATGRMQMGASTGTSADTAVISGGQNSGASAVLSVTEEYNRSVNVITGAAFSSGGNMTEAKSNVADGGTATAAVAGAGQKNNPDSSPTASNEYDGTTWTAGNAVPASYSSVTGATGTQTALITGGKGSGDTGTFEYDGTNWTAGGALGTGRYSGKCLGTQTAAAYCGGRVSPPTLNNVEEYDGSSWTAVTAMPIAIRNGGGFGTQTAGVVVSGFQGPSSPPVSPSPASRGALGFNYDGTNWTAGTSSLIAGASGGAAGIQTVGFFLAGENPALSPSSILTSQTYDGTSYTTNANTTRSRATAFGITSSRTSAVGTAAAIFGGTDPAATPNDTAATEEYNVATTALNIKTITTS
jgi:hypothetical protein